MKEFLLIIRRFVPPYKKNLFLNIFFNILSALLTLFSFALIIPILEMLFKIEEKSYSYMPMGSADFKDVVINNFYYYTQETISDWGPSAALALLALLLVGMTLLKCLTSYLAAYFVIPMRSGIVRDIRNYVYDKITSLPIGFFSAERKGDIMSRMTGDVSAIEFSIMSSLDLIFKNPVIIIACFAMMLAISWQLTLFVLVLLPISGYIMSVVGKSLKRSSLEAQQQWGLLVSNIEETLGGMRIIKAFTAEKKVRTRFHSENQTFYRLSNRIVRRQSLAHPMSELLGTITIAIVLWFGGTLILGGSSSINAASFIYYLVVFYSIINPVKEISKALYAVQSGLASMERVDMILSAKNPIQDPAEPKEIGQFHGEISYNNVSFSYAGNNVPVIRNVSLHIPAGATVALVGQSGSGKTTLADLLPRFYDVDSGSITVDGIDIRDMRVKSLRSLMGNVNQEAILFNDSFYNNITFGVDGATHEQVTEAARIANAHDFIMASDNGYDTNIGDRGCKLSGGQRQRLSIGSRHPQEPAHPDPRRGHLGS